MLNRRGGTLIELLVSLTLAAIVLGAATGSVLRQQRTHVHIAAVVASDGQLRAATGLMTGQLAFLDAAAGDLAAGEARDTSIQIRATIATAVACDSATGRVTFLPDQPDVVPLQGVASQPRAGDTLWYMRDSSWSGARISSVGSITAACPAPFLTTGPALRLTLAGTSDTIPAGAPVRITRPTRYSFYRSGDGTWQLGFREWAETAGSFSAPQPVAGPFLMNSDGRRSRFRFFASSGEELVGSGFEAMVSRIRVTTYAFVGSHEAGQDSVRCDSVDVALQHATAR